MDDAANVGHHVLTPSIAVGTSGKVLSGGRFAAPPVVHALLTCGTRRTPGTLRPTTRSARPPGTHARPFGAHLGNGALVVIGTGLGEFVLDYVELTGRNLTGEQESTEHNQ